MDRLSHKGMGLPGQVGPCIQLCSMLQSGPEMSDLALSLTSAIILQAVDSGLCYGFEIMDGTGLPSGTVYPALRRLEAAELIRSDWQASESSESQGPPRKYYVLTRDGAGALATAIERYRPIAQMKVGSLTGRK